MWECSATPVDIYNGHPGEVKKVASWFDVRGEWQVVHGPTGVGKTFVIEYAARVTAQRDTVYLEQDHKEEELELLIRAMHPQTGQPRVVVIDGLEYTDGNFRKRVRKLLNKHYTLDADVRRKHGTTSPTLRNAVVITCSDPYHPSITGFIKGWVHLRATLAKKNHFVAVKPLSFREAVHLMPALRTWPGAWLRSGNLLQVRQRLLWGADGVVNKNFKKYGAKSMLHTAFTDRDLSQRRMAWSAVDYVDRAEVLFLNAHTRYGHDLATWSDVADTLSMFADPMHYPEEVMEVLATCDPRARPCLRTCFWAWDKRTAQYRLPVQRPKPWMVLDAACYPESP